MTYWFDEERGSTFCLLDAPAEEKVKAATRRSPRFDSTVQLTARICDKAEPDQILAAPVIRDLCLGKSFSFTDQGESELKGFDQPLRMYEFQWREA